MKFLVLEGEFRACHSALINHSEEIAFYKGNNWEHEKLSEVFKKLTKHIDFTYGKKFYMGILDLMLTKYGAVIGGYSLLGLPVFTGNERYTKKHSGDASIITKDYIRNSGLLINLSKVTY